MYPSGSGYKDYTQMSQVAQTTCPYGVNDACLVFYSFYLCETIQRKLTAVIIPYKDLVINRYKWLYLLLYIINDDL